MSFFSTAGRLLSIVAAKEELMAVTSSSLGLPQISMIFSSWFIVLEPGTSGLPTNISAMMQPSAHMSTALVYEVDPSRISGARYQRVAT